MLPCPLSPRVCSNSGPLSQECHPTISSSVAPFSQHQVFSSDFLYICGHVTQPFWIRFFFLFYLTESCIIHTQRSFVGNVNCNYFPFTGHPNHVCYCKEQHNAHFSTLSFFLLLGLSINFFFFGQVRPSLLHWLFSSCSEQGLHSSCDVQASHHSGFFRCGAGSQELCTCLVALQHVRSSQTGDRTRVSCIGRQILYH